MDECITVHRVHDLSTVFSQNDGSPWFYPLVVWCFTSTLGLNEVTLRLPSLLAGAALGPVLFLILRPYFSRATSLVPALLGVFSPFSLFYSQEARVYSLAILLAAIWAGLLCRFLYPLHDTAPSSFQKVSFIFISPALALCHHYCLFVGIAGLAVGGMRLYQEPRLRARVLKLLAVAYAITIALWLPSMFVYTLQTTDQVLATQENPYSPHQLNLDRATQHVFGSPLDSFINPDNAIFANRATIPAIVLGAAVLGLSLGLPVHRREWFWGSMHLVCYLIALLVHAAVPNLTGSRYEAPFLSLALVSLGLALQWVAYRSVKLVLVSLLFLSQLIGCSYAWFNPMPKSCSRELAAYIASKKAEIVITTLPRGFDALYLMPTAWYLHEVHKLQTPIIEIPRFVPVSDGFLPPTDHYEMYQQLVSTPWNEVESKLTALLDRHKKVVLVGQRPEVERLVPVLNNYRIIDNTSFMSTMEGATIVLVIGQKVAP